MIAHHGVPFELDGAPIELAIVPIEATTPPTHPPGRAPVKRGSKAHPRTG